ncbi:hypothetical protein B7R54_04730 [Subtercola boreus]|uniref:AB hydrolase-1 domain-containing protein n=1 Tax=Subtercola boreus TaxID=120213 RepID=A0A3E0VGV8_9MICO|nr:alpha/beta hydrolase [Subtercola boreus]RFA08610.1 hypothetical protein B7R54_04730 [Subtercola boreus]TQL54452.1 pimeloyl-ACP methyl ester carboxylesterase [Subtercola boreus]
MPSITTSDGVRLDYRESGDPAGRPVVLLAGFLAPATSWRYQVDALGAAGFRMLALDLRGHGTSEHRDSGNSMARRAADLREFLVALALRDVVLVGGSMGGNTIWAYLDAEGPELVSQIVIIDQTPKMLNTTGHPGEAGWPCGFYGYTEANRHTLFGSGVPETGHGTPPQKRGRRIVRMLGATGSGGSPVSVLTSALRSVLAKHELTTGELELLHNHAVADWRDVIAASRLPVLFIAGRESEFWPAGHAAASALLGGNPAACSIVIENAGHATNLEQPDEVNLAVLEFLGPRVREAAVGGRG